MSLGGRVGLPSTQTTAKARKEFKRKLEDGSIDQGETINPQNYKVVVLGKDNELHYESKTVHGRKIPFSRLRKR